MGQLPGFLNMLPAIPVLLAHLAGVVVAVILLLRQERKWIPAMLALMGFGLLLVLDVGNFVRGPLARFLSRRTVAGVPSAVAGVGCCCSIVDAAAMVCLIVAIWQAFSRTAVEGRSRLESSEDS
ncbi:MAG: hypothetical protein KGY78_07495 [Anaerolineae bacterium]|nr:hypothetical protein [Anaerolineae bacterium]